MNDQKLTLRLAGNCEDGRDCMAQCGTGPCSRKCQVCQRLGWTETVPCPACPDHGIPACGRYGCVLPKGHNRGKADIPENHKTNGQIRNGRCPDGGYCHGASLAAGSAVCEPGRCLRVTTSGPLSGVFPGDRWPEDIVKANSDPEPPEDFWQLGGPVVPNNIPVVLPRPGQKLLHVQVKPDGKPLVDAIRKASELSGVLQDALGSRDGWEAVIVLLARAEALAWEIASNVERAERNARNAAEDSRHEPRS